MPEPVVVYEEYRKRYTRRGFKFGRIKAGTPDAYGRVADKDRGGYKPRSDVFSAPMGTFAAELLTADGKEAYEKMRKIVGKAASHRGVSKEGVYFKWLGLSLRDKVMVAADAVRDMGYDVEVEVTEAEVCKRLPRRPGEAFQITYSGKVLETYTKVKIKHPPRPEEQS